MYSPEFPGLAEARLLAGFAAPWGAQGRSLGQVAERAWFQQQAAATKGDGLRSVQGSARPANRSTRQSAR